jgi:hypothetical protein
MKNKHVLVAVLLTYVIVSLVPAIQLGSLLGKGKKK